MRISTGNKIWLSQASATIPSNKPIVFWDTCALLDILRIPLIERTHLNINTLHAYEDIEAWLRAGRLVSVTSDLVVKEFSQHADDIVNQLSQQEQKTKDEVAEQSQYMNNVPLAASIVTKVNMLDIQSKVVKLVKKILSQTIILKGQLSFAHNADYRVRNYIKPSGGKESYKDCYLWISYISLLNKVIPTEPVFFYTTNPADFAENKKSNKLHPDLISELPSPNCDCALTMTILNGKLTQYFGLHP